MDSQSVFSQQLRQSSLFICHPEMKMSLDNNNNNNDCIDEPLQQALRRRAITIMMITSIDFDEYELVLFEIAIALTLADFSRRLRRT